MPRNPKIFFPGSLHLITTSVEEGLMFPPNPLIEEIIKKSLAQAQQLHPVKISDILVEATHVHFFLQVIDPQDAADFMERFKCESAHAINRLLGRKKKTIWCEGYDSPLIDHLDTAVSKIAYLYENPSKDDLEESVDRFPGFNTFKLRLRAAQGNAPSAYSYQTRYIPRSDIDPLPGNKHLTDLDYQRLRRKLISKKKKNTFVIEPNCWMSRFGIKTEQEQREVSQRIVNEVRSREERHRKRRELANKPVIGRKRLTEQPVGTAYVPERTGKRMLTHCDDKDIRKATIKWLRALIQRGKEVLAEWRRGNTSVRYPLGLFPPTGIRLAEPIGW